MSISQTPPANISQIFLAKRNFERAAEALQGLSALFSGNDECCDSLNLDVSSRMGIGALLEIISIDVWQSAELLPYNKDSLDKLLGKN